MFDCNHRAESISCLVLFLALAACVQSACAGVVEAATDTAIRESMDPGAQLLSAPFRNIFVGEVVSVEEDGAGTNTSPPTGIVRVIEVLRGQLDAADYPCIWEASVRYTDLTDPSQQDYTQTEAWNNRVLNAPPAGTRFIGFARYKKYGKHHPMTGKLIISAENMYRVSAGNKSIIRDHAVPADRDERVQGLLVLAIMVLSLASFLLRVKNRRLALVAAAAVFPLYYIYETGISSWANIRIDLFVVYPFLLLTMISLYRLWRMKPS